ncbi:urokinase plasminogen activator surface receptor-like [Misgurnus anguillicaudatus]|uniref:urokinase plasminogen activator surface receptor-like n=1 Tax=Misgurnus anguillicaudatus TaxID=75329 RepID=UPI003CCF6DB7
MNLNVVFVFLCALFAGGHSLKCYECSGVTSSCVGVETTCPSNSTTCTSVTVTQSFGLATVSGAGKGCNAPQNCVNGSLNFGISRTALSMDCCNTDLCNGRDVTDYSSTTPNGKQCYYCNGITCSNKLNCSGTEDYCIKAQVTSVTALKGCASKSMCNVTTQVTQGYVGISCCQGNLCNGAKSITQHLLFVLWPFFFYILIH